MSQIQKIEKKGNGSVTMFSLATVIMTLLYTMPQTVVFIRNDMMAIIVTIYYALFISKYVSPIIILKTLLIAVPYLLLYWINNYPGNARLGFVLPFMTLWTFVMPCFAIMAAVKRNNIAEQRFILIATGVGLLYVYIHTFQALVVDPLIVREMAGGEEETILIARMKGVGGFGFAYAVGALFIAMFDLNRHIKKYSFMKIVFIVIIVMSGLMIVRTQYATLLFISILGVAIAYYQEAKTPIARIGVIVFVLFAFLASQTIISMGASMFGGDVLRYKFTLIYDSLWGNSGLNNISGDRSNYQLDAFYLFMRSPFWGNAGAVNMKAYAEAHSSFLSVMAATGIIGVTSWFFLFYSSCKRSILSIFPNVKDRSYYYPVLLFYFLFAWLNPVDFSFECAWMIFFIIPLLYVVFFNTIQD